MTEMCDVTMAANIFMDGVIRWIKAMVMDQEEKV